MKGSEDKERIHAGNERMVWKERKDERNGGNLIERRKELDFEGEAD